MLIGCEFVDTLDVFVRSTTTVNGKRKKCPPSCWKNIHSKNRKRKGKDVLQRSGKSQCCVSAQSLRSVGFVLECGAHTLEFPAFWKVAHLKNSTCQCNVACEKERVCVCVYWLWFVNTLDVLVLSNGKRKICPSSCWKNIHSKNRHAVTFLWPQTCGSRAYFLV